MESFPLHQHPEYLDECVNILNEEWPRSKTARFVSLMSTICDVDRGTNRRNVGYAKTVRWGAWGCFTNVAGGRVRTVQRKRTVCAANKAVISPCKHATCQTKMFVNAQGSSTKVTILTNDVLYYTVGSLNADILRYNTGWIFKVFSIQKGQNT